MPQPPSTRWHPVAAIAAWLAPGLGHVLLGQPRRGGLIAIGVGGMWILGLLVGGLSVIDRHEHWLWFLGQMLLAPSLIVEYIAAYLGNAGLLTASFGRPAEHGLLLTTLAGMLNLMAMLDALHRDPAERRHRPEAGAEPEAQAS